MFKVVIFDLVGVFSKHKNIYTILDKITGFTGTNKSMRAYIGSTYDKLLTGDVNELVFWNKLKKVTGSKKSIDSLKKSLFKEFKPLLKKEEFNKMRANFKVALCSDFVNNWWMYLKNKFKLDFDYEVLSSSLKVKKPDAGLYLAVPAFFKINPEECVYVSDEETDMEAAKSIGMQTIFIPGKSKHSDYADYKYNSINEVIQVLT